MIRLLSSVIPAMLVAGALGMLGCTNDNQAVTPNEPISQNDDRLPAVNSDADSSQVAVCHLEAIGDSGVTGTIRFQQDGESVRVTGEISGLEPGKHGFHVHEKGDLSDKETGKSAGGHFNPTNQKHGRPSDQQRHIGDLGNIEADDNGIVKVDISDDVISLSGEHSIVGKALVVHGGEDTFGQPSGDAGDRRAFGVIEAE